MCVCVCCSWLWALCLYIDVLVGWFRLPQTQDLISGASICRHYISNSWNRVLGVIIVQLPRDLEGILVVSNPFPLILNPPPTPNIN